MEVVHPRSEIRSRILVDTLEFVAFCIFAVTVWLVIYHDDIQLYSPTQLGEASTIYNARFFGLKLLDWLSVTIAVILGLVLFLRQEVEVSSLHKYILTILSIYVIAGVIGFVYAIIYDYPWERWYQDFQQTLYLVAFFFITFYLLSSLKRWRFFFVLFFLMLAAKNFIIFGRLFTNVGRVIGAFGMRTTQSADAAIFPALFAMTVTLVVGARIRLWLRLFLFLILIVYLFNTSISFGRTIWVILPVLVTYMFLELGQSSRKRLALYSVMFFLLSVALVLVFFPRFFELAAWKAGTIFEWSIQGDRSNATRVLEALNIGHRLLDQFALLHGMGLGAWWDDRAFPLLPDPASGLMNSTRFYFAHLWVLEQLLKIGLIGVVIYWWAIIKMFLKIRVVLRTIARNNRYHAMLLGLNAGFLGIMLTSTDFVKVFLITGVLLGMIARLVSSSHELITIPSVAVAAHV